MFKNFFLSELKYSFRQPMLYLFFLIVFLLVFAANVTDNVQIGGGSGVIKNISSNSKVMGYPAKDLKNFIKDNKW